LKEGKLCYDTSLTNDVKVFDTDEEANMFIQHAIEVLGNLRQN